MQNLLNWPPGWGTVLLLPALFVAFTVHELAHAVVAFLLGDTSQVERKRLSFNPLRHVSWLGMAAFLLVGFGWAKPVWVDYGRLRIKNRAFGMFLVSIAGAMANVLTALLALGGIMVSVVIVSWLSGSPSWDVLMLLLTQQPALDAQGLAMALSTYMVSVNLLLGLFNLLPLPPLDGFQALMSLVAVVRNALKGRTDDGALARLAGQTAGVSAPASSPAQIHFRIGLDYHKAGKMDEAIARYRQALAHDGQLAMAYYNQGLAYWAKGRPSLAGNAFRAAAHSGEDVNVRMQAGLRLQELAQVEQSPEAKLGPVPPPLEPGAAPEVAAGESTPLDPSMARRVWLRLAIGGMLMLILAVGMWLYVTAVTLASVS
jgi:Zn-dependent protease